MYKMYAMIVHKRLKVELEEKKILDYQAGFRRGKNTMGKMLILNSERDHRGKMKCMYDFRRYKDGVRWCI